MRYANIPKTDLTPSIICLGTADLGAKIGREAAFRLLDAFVAAGGTFIDTAKVYSDWIPGERSRSEKLLGEWLRARQHRSRIILGTKGAHPDLLSMNKPRMSSEALLSDIEASLRHLQTDVIDLYWLHRDDPATPVEVILDTLNTQVRAGKLRYLGCSNWGTARIKAAQAYAASSGQLGFAANQMLWNAAVLDPQGMADPTLARMDAAMGRWHAETQMAAVPYSSQAGGLFAKLQRPWLHTLPRQPKRLLLYVARSARNAVLARRSLYPRGPNLKRLQVMQGIAQAHGCTAAQVALGYLWAQPFPVFPIVGCQNIEQLQDSLQAAEVNLSAAEVQQVDGAG